MRSEAASPAASSTKIRPYNFNPGPGTLPESVLVRVRDEILDWGGTGMSVAEMSHRGADYMSIANRAESDLRELLGISESYAVLFLQGGATAQFAAVPLNLLGDLTRSHYVETGAWSRKAIAEARRYCEVNVAASAEAAAYSAIPRRSSWDCEGDAAYLHYTPNETIGGIEFHWIPEIDVPLVADMSSTILSRPVDVERFGVIYAGAQKNIGIAGLTVVIVRRDLLERAASTTPSVLNYTTQAGNGSMWNTPATFAWYVAGLVFEWTKAQGGLETIGAANQRKAAKLYAAIDDSDFYHNPVARPDRSWMNAPFTLVEPALDGTFLEEAAQAGMLGLKGHRSVGGMRASIYNAMPEAGIDALVGFMHDFEQRHG